MIRSIEIILGHIMEERFGVRNSGCLNPGVRGAGFWNTRYMDVALTHLREQGDEVREEDVERLSPLGNTHLNLLGRYRFPEDEAILDAELRPLHQPDPMDEPF